MTKLRITAGLLDNDVEIFEFNGKAFAVHNGQSKSFFDLPKEIIEVFWEELTYDVSALEELEKNGFVTKEQKLEKYIICLYGDLDKTADVIGEKLNQEYFDCGQRGSCPMEGIVCKPIRYKDHLLSHFELKMISLLATDDTIPVVAEKMGVCLNTLDQKKKKVFEKFGVLSRPKLVAEAFTYNLISNQYAS